MNHKKQEDRRSTLLINPKFQHKHILIGLLTVLVSVNVVIIAAMLMLEDVRLGFSAGDGAVIGAMELILVGLVGWVWLKRSHAIAGPVMVMQRNLERVRGGDLSEPMRMRHTDRFQDNVRIFNDMRELLRERIEAISLDVDRAAEHAGSTPELASILENVKQKLAFFKTGPDSSQEMGDEGGEN